MRTRGSTRLDSPLGSGPPVGVLSGGPLLCVCVCVCDRRLRWVLALELGCCVQSKLTFHVVSMYFITFHFVIMDFITFHFVITNFIIVNFVIIGVLTIHAHPFSNTS